VLILCFLNLICDSFAFEENPASFYFSLNYLVLDGSFLLQIFELKPVNLGCDISLGPLEVNSGLVLPLLNFIEFLSELFLSTLKSAPPLGDQLPLFSQLLFFANDLGFPSLQFSLVCGTDLGDEAVNIAA